MDALLALPVGRISLLERDFQHLLRAQEELRAKEDRQRLDLRYLGAAFWNLGTLGDFFFGGGGFA